MAAAGHDPARARPRRRGAAPGRHVRRAARRAGPRRWSTGAPVGGRLGDLAARPLAARPAGEANHAGTTRLADRRRPDARPGRRGARRPGRGRAARHASPPSARCGSRPNGVNAIPSRGDRLARRPRPGRGRRAARVVADVGARRPAPRPGRGVVDRRRPTSTPACATGSAALLGGAPVLPTGAGHDAGILAAAGVPTAMLFVRNPTGVSHSPAEHAEPADCQAGVAALARAIEALRVTCLLVRARLARPTARSAGVRGRRGRRPDRGRRRGRRPGPRRRRGCPASCCPGFANAHSHAFHRALRGRTHDRRRHVLDLARADVRRRRAARPRHLPGAGPRGLRRDGAGRGHRASASSTTCTTPPGGGRYADPNAMGEALIAGRRRRRDPADPARHLLPRRRPRAHRPPAARRRPEAVRRRRRRGLGRPGRRAARARPALRVGAAIHSVRAVPRRAAATVVAAAAGRPAARAPLRAARRERGLPGRLRPHPDRAARRPGPARPGDHRRARHPPDRRRRRAARRAPAPAVCVCPTTERDLADGIGPVRRLRDAGSPLCLGSDQHAPIDLLEEARRWSCTSGWSPASAAGSARPSWSTRSPSPGTARSAGRTPGGSRRGAGRPGRRPAGHARARRAARPTRSSWPPAPPTCTPWSSTAGSSSSDGRHVLGDVGRLLAAAIEPAAGRTHEHAGHRDRRAGHQRPGARRRSAGRP